MRASQRYDFVASVKKSPPNVACARDQMRPRVIASILVFILDTLLWLL